jgi:hypothetical protein
MLSPQTEPTRSPQTEPTRSPGTDPLRSPQTGARGHAPRPPPVELDAEGQALRERLRTFRKQAVRKNYKASTRPPATLLLSPEYQNVFFLSPLSTHNSPRSASSWQFLESAVVAMMVFVSQHEKISMRAPRLCVAYQAPHAVAAEASHAVAAEASHAVAADGTHAVAGDGSHAVAGDGSRAVAADQRAFLCKLSRVSPPTTP